MGAAWGGKKVMTVTSGPGFSPDDGAHRLRGHDRDARCVVADVQRGGPSTGLPTLPAQQDMMQVSWGSHGDYEIIALSPNIRRRSASTSMIKAFNLSENYRCPVFIMMDEMVGHMNERVVIPPAEKSRSSSATWTTKPKDEYRPYETTGEDLVPEMVKAGDGYRFHVTGLTHDERGYPALTPRQDQLVTPSDGEDRRERRQDRRRARGRHGGRGRRGGLLRHHFAHRHGGRGGCAARGPQGRPPPPRHRLALPRDAHPRTRRQGQGDRRAGIELWARWSWRSSARPPGKVHVISVPHAGGTVHEPEAILAASWRQRMMSTRAATSNAAYRLENPVMPYLRAWSASRISGAPAAASARRSTPSPSAHQTRGMDLDQIAIVSGIGCTGRVAGYVNLDSFHTTHGRAIPFATGLKLANPSLKVVVYSRRRRPDAIGGNHFIHAARRNMDLMVVCVNNFTYGMTGGQVAPTTPLGADPDHHALRQLRAALQPAVPGRCLRRGLCRALDGLTTSRSLPRPCRRGWQRKGFVFIEALSPCPTLYSRRNRLGDGVDQLKYYKERAIEARSQHQGRRLAPGRHRRG